MSKFYKFILIFLFIIPNLYAKNPVRIKDIAIIDGIRKNQLMGFGLVTGLQGRGDSKGFKLTQKMLQNLALNHGFSIDLEDIKSKNIAAVLVTAEAGAFTRKGDLINVTLSSIGDSKSLEGGILLQTALKGADDTVYAVAQGRILAGLKSQQTQTSASIPNGAVVERDIVSDYIQDSKVRLILRYPDFVTATQIKDAVSGLNSNLEVSAVDPGLVEITLGEEEKNNPVDFIAQLEVLTVTPDYASAVVIDKKSGIIVIGEDINIQECSVSIPSARVRVSSSRRKNNLVITGQTVGDLVQVLNEAGLDNNEIISLIESIHKIGAINAQLILL